MLAYGRLLFAPLFGIPDFSERIYKILANLSFICIFSIGACAQMCWLTEIIFWASVWDPGFQQAHIQFQVNVSLEMHSFHWPSAEMCWLSQNCFLHIYSEFCISATAYTNFRRISVSNASVLDFSEHIWIFSVNFSFIMYILRTSLC